MSNKVTNIYIDTTGFCDDALRRVFTALDTIVEHNNVENFRPSAMGPCGGQNVAYFNSAGVWYYAGTGSYILDGKRSVGLWELESIASRCKQEKKEDALPTRNIYIDARKLDQEERLNAYQSLGGIASGSSKGWLPTYLADYAEHDEALILFDVFAVNQDGNLLFFSGDRIEDMSDHLKNPKELTFNQLMSLAR